MSLIPQSQLPKTFFVSQNEDSLREEIRALEEQIFQLINYGGYSEEYICSMETQARIHAFELVEKKLEKEKEAHEAEAKKIRAQSNSAKSMRKPRR